MRHAILALLLLVSLCAQVRAQETAAVSVPIRLDYALIRQMLVKQLFTGPGQSRQLLSDDKSCNRIVLTDPGVAPRDQSLEIRAQAAAQVGLNLFGACYTLLEWQGSVGFLGLPVIRPGATSLGLRPQGVWLTKADGDRVTSGRMWDYAQAPLQELFSSFTIDLAPFTVALGSLLPDVLPNRSAAQVQDTLGSLQLGNLRLAPDGLNAALNFSVHTLTEAPPPEQALSPEELQRWEARWQLMDAVLVFAVKHYASATPLANMRSTLLDVLIDSRYQLVQALAEPVELSNDVVRRWFLESWQKLSPVVRSIALEQEGMEPLMWMSVLAATDALYAMDRVGPQIGLDISEDGLRRLARMIDQDVQPADLLYDDTVDPELQQLLQQQIDLRAAQPMTWNFKLSLIMRAYAQEPGDRLNSWVPEKEEVAEYLPLVSKLLDESSDNILKKHKLDKIYYELYKKLVLATAWQESCWRQYVVNGGNLEPLRSSTGDVGLMQVNERVWRGFYDLQKLRWDITYNSSAGAEVLFDYLVKYAIQRQEHQRAGGLDNLARASYSAYNGGPSKASRYRMEDVPSRHRKIDTAFWKKYLQINDGYQEGIARCLGEVT